MHCIEYTVYSHCLISHTHTHAITRSFTRTHTHEYWAQNTECAAIHGHLWNQTTNDSYRELVFGVYSSFVPTFFLFWPPAVALALALCVCVWFQQLQIICMSVKCIHTISQRDVRVIAESYTWNLERNEKFNGKIYKLYPNTRRIKSKWCREKKSIWTVWSYKNERWNIHKNTSFFAMKKNSPQIEMRKIFQVSTFFPFDFLNSIKSCTNSQFQCIISQAIVELFLIFQGN